MPQDLAALLLGEGAVSQADLERALARQAEVGGSLDSALLELALVPGARLLAFLARASGLPSAPEEAFQAIDARARRVFPAKVAERHRLAPFALDGRDLSVVAVHPVDAAAIDEIGFMLSLTLVPYVGLEWRVHELIHRLYGGQLSARLARIAAAPPAAEGEPRGGEAPPAAVAAATPASATAPASASGFSDVEEAFFAAGDTGSFSSAAGDAAPSKPAGIPPAPPPPTAAAPEPEPEPAARLAAPEPPPADEASFTDLEPNPPRPAGFTAARSEPSEPLLAALESALDAFDAIWEEPAQEPPAAEAAPAPSTSAPAPAEPPPTVRGPTPPAAPELVAPAPPEPPAAAPSAPLERAPEAAPTAAPEAAPEPEEPPPILDRSAPPRWRTDDARAALADAVHRDQVVVTTLRYARDFFEHAALFAVTRDAVVGHDALGGADDARQHARATALYVTDPGIVKTVLETRAPFLGPVARDAAGTTAVLDGLGRGTPRTVLLYPIVVGDRPVAVLYADNGEAPVSSRRLGDLILFLSTVGLAFERILRTRKKTVRTPARRAGPKPAPAPAPAPAPEANAPAAPDPAAPDPGVERTAEPPGANAPPDSEAPAVAPAGEAVPVARSDAAPAAPSAPAVASSLDAIDVDDVGEVPPPAPGFDAVGAIEDLLATVRGSPERERAIGLLVEHAAAAAEPLCARLPGLLDPGVLSSGGLPPWEEGPIPQALAALGGAASRHLAVLLGDADPERRRMAVALLGRAGDGRSLGAIAERTFDANPRVAAAAREALASHRSSAAVKPLPERLRRSLLSGVGDRPIQAARALGALRDVASIPILIQALEGAAPSAADAAAEALAQITLQRLGTNAQKWLHWWKENRGRTRAEWLFAALDGEDRDLRLAASGELRASGEPPVRYTPDLPAAERSEAARAWWTWWSRQGLSL